MRRLPALIAAAGLVAVLAGCSEEAEAPQVPPTEQLAAAKTAFDAAKTVSLTLTSRDVPPRENGVTAAKGVGVIDATEPKFQGTITGTVEGIAATIDAPPTITRSGGTPNITSERIPSGISMPARLSQEMPLDASAPTGRRSNR